MALTARRGIRGAAWAGLLLALTACETPPPERPAPLGERARMAAPARPSEASRRAAAYYRGVEADLRSRGLMRTDTGGPGLAVSRRRLVEDFIRIALYDEYTPRAGSLVEEESTSRLRRWETPIRMRIVFGDSVPAARRRADRKEVARYARRLARLTGLDISTGAGGNANYHVLVLGEDERRAVAPRLRRLVPGIGAGAVRTITEMPRSTFCLVFAFSEGDASAYSRAVAVIRAEHPDLLRRSCIHEELAQSLGLANDSPTARPSIFNDDEEFALLTRHDELLLRMLYDPRLRPGMTAEQVRPIARRIAADLLGGTG